MKIKFMHISDLHYKCNYQEVTSIFRDTLNKMDNPLIQLKSLLNNYSDNLDFVILTGDLCEFGTVEDYQNLKDNLSRLFNVPIISTPGNHDNKDNYCTGYLSIPIQDNIVFAYYVKGIRVISLDSSSKDDNDGCISDISIRKFKNLISDDNTTPTIVITHHHLIPEQFVMRTALYPKELLAILQTPCIKAIFNGHTHHPYIGTFANKPYFTAGSLSFVGENNKDNIVDYYQQASFSIVTYNGINFNYDIYSENNTRYLSSVKF